MPPINVDEVRLKVANRQPISIEEVHALFAAQGLFAGREVIRTPNGFVIIIRRPGAARRGQQNLMQQQQQQLGSRIEVSEHRIRGFGTRGDRELEQQMALMAKLRWGQGATVFVRGSRRLRRTCRDQGLIVINNNPHAQAWRQAWRTLTLQPIRGPQHPRAATPPQPQPA